MNAETQTEPNNDSFVWNSLLDDAPVQVVEPDPEPQPSTPTKKKAAKKSAKKATRKKATKRKTAKKSTKKRAKKKATKKKTAKKPSKPKTPVVDVPVSRCDKCGSTKRDKYARVRKMEIPGLDDSGERYEAIVLRRTKCLDCGQHRVDRHFEYESAKA